MLEVGSSSIVAEQQQMVDDWEEGARKKKLLYVVLPELKYTYSVHTIDISDPEASLKEPILMVEKDVLPWSSSVAAVNSHIFMVGGKSVPEPGKTVTCRQVWPYDTVSSRFCEAPPLNSGKSLAILLASGSKLFALSKRLHDKAAAWRVLPGPDIPPMDERCVDRGYNVRARAVSASGDFIFISMPTPGTFVFDVAKESWTHVSQQGSSHS